PSGEKIDLKEYRFSVAGSFLGDRLALGVSLAPNVLRVNDESFTVVRAGFGALYRFPRRLFVGASYAPASTFGPDRIQRPFRFPHDLSAGAGWMPNRFFRAALRLRAIAPEESETFSFHDPTERVGAGWAGQLHAGLDYSFLSTKRFQARLFVGSYLES